jgi:hypothetical protein
MMVAIDHFDGTTKSCYREKQLKKNFLKEVKTPESC